MIILNVINIVMVKLLISLNWPVSETRKAASTTAQIFRSSTRYFKCTISQFFCEIRKRQTTS
jgi:hypothetical protein